MKFLLALVFASAALAQPVTGIRFVTTDPTGACSPIYIAQNTVTGILTGCVDGNFATIGGGSPGTSDWVITPLGNISGAVTLHVGSTQQIFTGTLTGDVIVTASDTGSASFLRSFVQDIVGGHTVTCDASFSGCGATDPAPSQGCYQAFVWVGTAGIARPQGEITCPGAAPAVTAPEITPTALSGDVDNYNPTNCGTAYTLRLDSGAADRNITGINCGAGTGVKRFLRLLSIGAHVITLKSESASSTNIYRAVMTGDTALPTNAALELEYDTVSLRWRPSSRSLSNTGVTAGQYGDSTHIAQFTADSSGRVTQAANIAFTGGGGFMLFAATTASVGAPANTGMRAGLTAVTTGAQYMPVPASTATAIMCRTSSAIGNGETVTFTLLKNGSTTLMTCVITGPALVGIQSGGPISYTADQTVGWNLASSSGAGSIFPSVSTYFSVP